MQYYGLPGNAVVQVELAHACWVSVNKGLQIKEGGQLTLADIHGDIQNKKTCYFPFPVSLFRASRYFSPVLTMISAGSGGAGAVLFQSRVSR